MTDCHLTPEAQHAWDTLRPDQQASVESRVRSIINGCKRSTAADVRACAVAACLRILTHSYPTLNESAIEGIVHGMWERTDHG